MEQVSSLITQKLKMMAKAEDHRFLQSKCKAITTLLPHAVRQERGGRPEVLDAILCAARVSRLLWFAWCRVSESVSMMLSKASPRAVALASPYIRWDELRDRGDLVQQWAATASVAPHTAEIVQSVVDALLQIASEDKLVPYIPNDLWSWLNKCPSLPPVSLGRSNVAGRSSHVVDAVRALNDIEVLKAYLLVVWSEWDYLYTDGLERMCVSFREDFGGIGMGHHRADLIQRLDHVLGELDRGSEYLEKHGPSPSEGFLQTRKIRYQVLREKLQEVNTKAISRTPSLSQRSSTSVC